MADNKVSNPGAGGATFATDDIGGVDWPFAKLAWGPRDTANEVDDAVGKRFPIKIAESVSLDVSGSTVTVTSGNPDNLLADVRGMTSRDAVMSDAPVIVGGRASTATPAAVSADGDVVDAWFSRNGALPYRSGRYNDKPISAAALPLPAGASTSALQTQPGVDIGDVTINRRGWCKRRKRTRWRQQSHS